MNALLRAEFVSNDSALVDYSTTHTCTRTTQDDGQGDRWGVLE